MIARMFKKWHVFMTVMVVTALLAMPVSAGISGPSAAGIQVQNLTTSSNIATVTFYPQGGGGSIALPSVTIGSESAQNYYVPNLSQLTDSAYAVVVSAQNQAAGIARTDWASTGGAAIYSTSAPGKSVLVPLILGDYGSQTSQVSIQNTNTAGDVTDVKLELYARGNGSPIATLSNQTIERGTSKTWSLNDGVWGQLPDTGLDLGQSGFIGSLVITSDSTDLAVQSFIDIAGTSGVTGFGGVASSAASNTVFCPLARANFYGDTGISIVNNNDNPANVTITFRADPASPNPGTFTQSVSVGANSSNIAFQGPGGNSRTEAGLPGGTQTSGNTVLTNDGFYGSAVITADQPVVAVINDTEFGAGYSVKGQSTYNCVPSSAAGLTHFLPLLRNGHVAANKLTTGVQVLNTTGSAGTVSLNLVSWDGTDATDPASKSLDANGAANFYGGSWTGLPTVPPELGGAGWFGSGVITCSTPCVVLVSDESGPGASTALDRANYIGIPN